MSRDVAKTIEDLEFMDESHCGAFEASERAGFPSAEAMEKWLERHDAYDLWLSFKSRDARGSHSEETRRMSAVPSPKSDPIIATLDAADESPRAATRRKAERVRSMLSELRETMAAETEDAERKTAAKAEVERLTKALAEARANLRGGPVVLTVAGAVSAAELRAWAKGRGIDCPAMGRVPTTVREQYEAEREAAAS